MFWQELVFLEAALLADDATKGLAAIITPVLDEFAALLQLDLDTRRAIIQASARSYVADALLDGGLRGLFSAVLHLVGQDRKRPEFTTLFSSHIADIVRHALKRQLEVAAAITEKLSLKLYPEELRVAQTALLEPLMKTGKAVVEETREAALTRVGARLDIATWKDEANAARLTAYAQLLGIAAATGRKKAWAEGFFPRVASSAGADPGDDLSEDDAPEPGAAPLASDANPA